MAEGATIYWGDETAVAENGYWLCGYAPARQTPILAAPHKHRGLSMVSAISNQTLARFEFIGFMERLISDSSQKEFLILNNPMANHAKWITTWLVGG